MFSCIFIEFIKKFICPVTLFVIFWNQQIAATGSMYIYLFRPFGQLISGK